MKKLLLFNDGMNQDIHIEKVIKKIKDHFGGFVADDAKPDEVEQLYENLVMRKKFDFDKSLE